MTGKTHLTFATALTLAILRPDSPQELVLFATASAVGGVLPDIDCSSSGSHKAAVRVCRTAAVLIAAAVVAEKFFNVGMWDAIEDSLRSGHLFPSVLWFLFLCWYGAHQPHRTFTHSAIGTAAFIFSIAQVLPQVALPFGIAYVSHIGLDLMNKTKLKLMWPRKDGWALNICPADGTVNNSIFSLSSMVLLIEAVAFAANRI